VANLVDNTSLPILEEPEFSPWTLKDVSAATGTQVTSYISSRMEAYTEETMSGSELHALWASDFEFFSEVEYKKSTIQTRALRDFFRSRNVLVLKKGLSIATELVKAQRAQWEPMPIEYQHEFLDKFRPIFPISKATKFRGRVGVFVGITILLIRQQAYQL
ncbi:hypothetical protein GcM3_034027, partial [Golovinomyces cichoracearum]